MTTKATLAAALLVIVSSCGDKVTPDGSDFLSTGPDPICPGPSGIVPNHVNLCNPRHDLAICWYSPPSMPTSYTAVIGCRMSAKYWKWDTATVGHWVYVITDCIPSCP